MTNRAFPAVRASRERDPVAWIKRTHAVSRRELDSARAPEFGLHELKHIVATLRAALRWGMRVGLIVRNPADGVAPVKVPRREMRALDGAGVAALVEAARGSDLAHLVVVAVGTGFAKG